jgi:hypothetical protein
MSHIGFNIVLYSENLYLILLLKSHTFIINVDYYNLIVRKKVMKVSRFQKYDFLIKKTQFTLKKSFSIFFQS